MHRDLLFIRLRKVSIQMLTMLQIASEFGSGTTAFEFEEPPTMMEPATRKPKPVNVEVALA